MIAFGLRGHSNVSRDHFSPGVIVNAHLHARKVLLERLHELYGNWFVHLVTSPIDLIRMQR